MFWARVAELWVIFILFYFYFIFVHAMCLAGSHFPNQGLNLGHSSESPESFFLFFWLRWVFVAVCGLFIAAASLVAEHGL